MRVEVPVAVEMDPDVAALGWVAKEVYLLTFRACAFVGGVLLQRHLDAGYLVQFWRSEGHVGIEQVRESVEKLIHAGLLLQEAGGWVPRGFLPARAPAQALARARVTRAPAQGRARSASESSLRDTSMDTQKNEGGPRSLLYDAEVALVFAHWVGAMQKQAAKLTPDRRTVIEARLLDGYTLTQLLHAVQGCASSAWHMGKNDRARAYNDLDLICRNARKLEDFVTMFHAAKEFACDAPSCRPYPPSMGRWQFWGLTLCDRHAAAVTESALASRAALERWLLENPIER